MNEVNANALHAAGHVKARSVRGASLVPALGSHAAVAVPVRRNRGTASARGSKGALHSANNALARRALAQGQPDPFRSWAIGVRWHD